VGLIRLFNSSEERKLWQSHLSLESVTIKEITSDNRWSVNYTLLQRNFSGSFRSPWSRALASGFSLAMGLYKSDRTELTFTDVFTNLDEVTKEGTLLLDTAAINTEFAGAATQLTNCIFEIRVTDSAGNKHTFYRETGITLNKPLIAPLSASVAPTEIAATQEWVKNTCLPRDGTNPLNPAREVYFKTSPSGFNARVWVDDDGLIQSEKF